MSTETPPLPPRHIDLLMKEQEDNATTTTTTTTPLGTIGTLCLSPLALLLQLEHSSFDQHVHDFKTFVDEKPTSDSLNINKEEEEVKLIEMVDLDDLQPTPINQSTTITHAICQVCHIWLNVTHTAITGKKNDCLGNDYVCHHYHYTASEQVFKCCGCDYTVATEFQEPILPMTLFQRLEATRKKVLSYAERMQQQQQLAQMEPTLVSTLTTMLIYIKDLLNGVDRTINCGNPKFLRFIGLSDASQSLLESIGFIMQDNFFIPPSASALDVDRLKRIQHEITLVVDILRKELGNTLVPIPTDSNIIVKSANMEHLFGIHPNLEKKIINGNLRDNQYLERAYSSIGLTLGSSDVLVEWTYKRLLQEEIIDEYDLMDALTVIASNKKKSDILSTLIIYERSRGRIAKSDIGDSYAYFGVYEDYDNFDDGVLIGLYQLKLSDYPLEKNLHQEKLKIIAIARHSTQLFNFLKQEKGITSLNTNDKAIQDIMGVPASMINNVQHTPVGLNNIGNTCYFNSLLQYYFTFVPFRNTMIFNEQYVEDENSELKKIGGIEVDQSEIRRAKKFVELLKTLFINLEQTQENAISPEYELAYMALLNEKEEDEPEASTFQVAQEASNILTEVTKDKEKKDPIETTKTLGTITSNSPGLLAYQESNDAEMTEASDLDENLGLEQDAATFAESHRLPPQDVDEEKPANDSETKTYSPSQYTDAQIESAFRRASCTNDFEIKPPISPPPPYEGNVQDVQPEKKELPKLKQRPSADTMMFGKQQDVTECMGNVMYLVEAALKPLQKTEDGEQINDMVRQVFYGKARQILSYCDNTTLQVVKKEMEEDFSHVIVDASEGKDLYDGLDEYFFEEQVENFQGGHEATREVTVKSFPPVLQILVQRVQFDRATANVYKSNAYIQFDRMIHLDRYADSNFEELKERRNEVASWRSKLEKTRKQVSKYAKSSNLEISIPDLLDATRQILSEMKLETDNDQSRQYEKALKLLTQEAEEKRKIIQEGNEKIEELKHKIKTQYNDYTELAYKLHAVFIHQGQANYGHYWIYILDHDENQWWKYNDSLVTKVNESEIFHDTTGSTANPYFLVYVVANKVNEFVETVVKKSPQPPALMTAPIA